MSGHCHILTRYLCSVPVICLPTQDQASISPDTRLPSPARLSQVRPLHVSASSSEKLSWSWHRNIESWGRSLVWLTWVCDHKLPDSETPRKMEAPATPQMTRVPREQTVMLSYVSWLRDQNILSTIYEIHSCQEISHTQHIATASWLRCCEHSLAPHYQYHLSVTTYLPSCPHIHCRH